MYRYEIYSVSIDEINNKVSIYFANQKLESIVKDTLINLDLYSESAVYFVVDPKIESALTSRSIHGGDGIFRMRRSTNPPGITTFRYEWQGEPVTISNSFRLNTEFNHQNQVQGDSGGPIYIRGSNNSLHLIGMTFGATLSGIFNPRIRIYACRILSIMRPVEQGGLDVTPITGDFTTRSVTGGVEITGAKGTLFGRVTIPSHIDGQIVRTIATSAFSSQTRMIHITLPSTIHTIGAHAFNGATSLESIDLSRVNEIGEFFINGTLITQITIPNTVLSLSSRAFIGANMLERIDVEEGNWFFRSADGVLFSATPLDDGQYSFGITQLMAYPAARQAHTYEIPLSTTRIGEYAFVQQRFLRKVRIPQRVESIGINAFIAASQLNEVQFQNLQMSNLESIGNGAFRNIPSLKSMHLPTRRLEYIGAYAFADSICLSMVTIGSRVSHVGQSAFAGWTYQQTIHINGRNAIPISWHYRWNGGAAQVRFWPNMS